MNVVTIDGSELVITPRGIDKILGFRRELRVALDHVWQVITDPQAIPQSPETRLMGTTLFAKHVGTFFSVDEHEYWNVTHSGPRVSVELRREGFARAVLTVSDAGAVERLIWDASRAGGGGDFESSP